MQSLMYLKQRFDRDPTFHEDYKQFIINLLVKVYARDMDDSPVEKLWCIIHHGVYQPSKSRKVRVVFDFSDHLLESQWIKSCQQALIQLIQLL